MYAARLCRQLKLALRLKACSLQPLLVSRPIAQLVKPCPSVPAKPTYPARPARPNKARKTPIPAYRSEPVNMPRKHAGKGPDTSKAGVCYMQILGLGTDTQDTLPSVLVFFEHQRLLFNAGEGFQRYCTQHKVKMSKLSSVLATRMSTEALGGVPGMLLTMSDAKSGHNVVTAGKVLLTLYGPTGMTKLYNAMRTFINVRDLGLKAVQFDGVPEQSSGELPVLLTDPLYTVRPIVLMPTTQDDTSEPPAKRHKTHDKDTSASRPAAAEAGEQLQDGEVRMEEHEAVAVAYVVEMAPVRGKFLPERALALGVPKGPLFGKLQRGESITSPLGCTVTPEQVMEPSSPGPIMCVVDCPALSYLPSLLKSATFHRLQHQLRTDTEPPVCVMAHLTPLDVASSEEYKTWMASFGSHVKHMMVQHTAASSTLGLISSAQLHAQLHAIDSQVFPLPPVEAPSTPSIQEQADAMRVSGEAVVPGLSLSRYILLPVRRHGIDIEECAGNAINLAEVWDSMKTQHAEALALAPPRDSSGTLQGLTDGAGSIPECIIRAGRQEMELVFLGTGAAMPSKYRNVTGMYMHLFDRGGLLVDCGEGSLGQLKRRFGSGCDDVLRGLRCVWISHIHADHHVGLPRLLNARKRLLGADCPPLLVLGPRPLRRALLAYSELEPMAFQYVDCVDLVPQAFHKLAEGVPAQLLATVQQALEQVREQLQLTELSTIPVIHCRHSFGLVVAGQAGWKVVFSGDTRPCPAVVDAARGATLLVHEATFEDELAEEAVQKRHSTISDAVQAGMEAGCYRTILTHFSQRYPKIPVLSQQARESGSVAIAFDLMSVNLAELPHLPSLVPALEKLFEKEEQREKQQEAIDQ